LLCSKAVTRWEDAFAQTRSSQTVGEAWEVKLPTNLVKLDNSLEIDG